MLKKTEKGDPHALTSSELEQMIPKGVRFGGVFSKDQLPTHPQNNTFYIINLEDFADGEGTHWCVIWSGPTYACYYDPYGMPFPDEVQEFIGNKKIHYNNIKHQMMSSVLCGYYCIACIRYLSQSGSKVKLFTEFCNRVMSNKPQNNNKRIKEMFNLR